MKNSFHRDEEGQLLLWVALVAGLLIIFTAMAVDMGNIYYHKARLSNAVDAAVLEGVKLYGTFNNSGQQITQAQAQQYADDVFVANYGDSTPTRSWLWCPIDVVGCPAGNALSLTLRSQAPVNTSFMAYWPQWAQWTIGDVGQATRSILVMSMVLDRSGSMDSPANGGDGGGPALQAAVPNFVADFVQGTDYLSMISFSSDARVDVPVTQQFVTPINTAVNAFTWNGGTFGTGGGTTNCPSASTNCPPMSLADNQNATGVMSAGMGSPITKVVIYFTDGLMNTVQDTFACTNLGNVTYNYGGYDNPSTSYDFFIPSGALPGHGSQDLYPYNDYSYYYAGPASGSCNGGTTGTCNNNPPYGAGNQRCQGITNFQPQAGGARKAFSQSNILAEARWRALYTSDQMRMESPIPTYFFVVGLGNSVTCDPGTNPCQQCTEALLSTIANDPSGPGMNYNCPTGGALYNSNEPQGLFLVVPDCPSSTCTSELNTAFQTIAAKILLRLSL